MRATGGKWNFLLPRLCRLPPEGVAQIQNVFLISTDLDLGWVFSLNDTINKIPLRVPSHLGFNGSRMWPHPYCWRHQTLKTQDLDACELYLTIKLPFLWCSFHRTGKSCVGCNGKGAVKQPQPATAPVHHSSVQPGKISTHGNGRHSRMGGHQPLSNQLSFPWECGGHVTLIPGSFKWHHPSLFYQDLDFL